jgi:hypothetical protein
MCNDTRHLMTDLCYHEVALEFCALERLHKDIQVPTWCEGFGMFPFAYRTCNAHDAVSEFA